MRNEWSKLGGLLITLFLVGATPLPASSPPPRKTLSERVNLASHVMIGTAEKVTIVQFEEEAGNSNKLQTVVPQPKSTSPGGQWALVQIKVDEVLYPHGQMVPKTIQYLFGGGHFGLDTIRKDVIGKQHIYLMDRSEINAMDKSGKAFWPSYGWHLYDALGDKTTIKKLLWARIVNEAKAKQKARTHKS